MSKSAERRPLDGRKPIRTAPGARHTCRLCAHSCHNYTVVLSELEARRLALDEWRPLLHKVPDDLPLVQRQGAQYILNKRPDGACVFLGADGLCVIHKESHPESKPLACQMFPLQAVQAPDGVYLSLNSGCRRLIDQGEVDPLLDEADARRMLSQAAGLISLGETIMLSPTTMILYEDFLHWQDQIEALIGREVSTFNEFWERLQETARLILTIEPEALTDPVPEWQIMFRRIEATLRGDHNHSGPRQMLVRRVLQWIPQLTQTGFPLTLPQLEIPGGAAFCARVTGQFLAGRQAAFWETAIGAWSGLVIGLTVGIMAAALIPFDPARYPAPGHVLNDTLADALMLMGLPSAAVSSELQKAFLRALG